MDSSSQIDTVQKFAEVIGDHDDLWNLLVGREVSRFDNKLEYEHSRKDIQGVTFYQQGKVIEIKYLRTSKFLLRVDYGSGFIFKYSKKQFIRKFNQIVPSIIWDEVLKLTPGVRWEETKIGKKLWLLRPFYGELILKCQFNKLRNLKLLKLRNPYPSLLINLSLLLIPSTVPLVVLSSK